MAAVIVGAPAPDFTLPDAAGKEVRLADYRGKKVVLYFYPKDNTSGCTKEACAFRDAIGVFGDKNAVILGVSSDTAKSHQGFIAKFQLPFALLTDADRRVADLYGVWKEKTMYGKKTMGIERSTFVIDEKGTLVEAMRKVKVDGHIEALLARI